MAAAPLSVMLVLAAMIIAANVVATEAIVETTAFFGSLSGPQRAAYDLFGYSIAANDRYLAVGSIGNDIFKGTPVGWVIFFYLIGGRAKKKIHLNHCSNLRVPVTFPVANCRPR